MYIIKIFPLTGCMVIIIFSYLVWIVSSVVGCLIGSMIPNPELFGLDFA